MFEVLVGLLILATAAIGLYAALAILAGLVLFCRHLWLAARREWRKMGEA